MAERQMGQLSLVDGLVAGVASSNEFLERVSALVDWGSVEAASRRPAQCYRADVNKRTLLRSDHQPSTGSIR